MKILWLVPVAALLSGCLLAQDTKQIIVDARASVKVMPDQFELDIQIYSIEASQETALAKVAGIYQRIKTDAPQLAELETFKLTTSGVSTEAVHDQKCVEDAYDEQACPIIGYKGSISASIEAMPTRVAGSMLSFVSELGATSVSFSGYEISDYQGAKEQALKAAAQDARRKAEIIANASGTSLVGPSKIQIGSGFGSNGFADSDDTIIVTGSRLYVPKISLNIEPQPQTVSASITAAFEIE